MTLQENIALLGLPDLQFERYVFLEEGELIPPYRHKTYRVMWIRQSNTFPFTHIVTVDDFGDEVLSKNPSLMYCLTGQYPYQTPPRFKPLHSGSDSVELLPCS
jgi:hypothetical protein